MAKEWFKCRASKNARDKDGEKRTLKFFVEAGTLKSAYSAAGHKARDVFGEFNELEVAEVSKSEMVEHPNQTHLAGT